MYRAFYVELENENIKLNNVIKIQNKKYQSCISNSQYEYYNIIVIIKIYCL